MLTYITDNLAGKPRSAVLDLFSSGMFGNYHEAQEAYLEILNSRIPISTIFSPETPVGESEGLMVLGKVQIEALIAHAISCGYGEAYNRLSVNVQALPYIPAFKEELLSSLYEDRPIDAKKFKSEQKTTVGDHEETKKKRPWSSQDHRGMN